MEKRPARTPAFSYSRGVATTAQVIIILLIFMTFFGVYTYMANNQVQSQIRLNLESFEVLKLKSTFYLFNRSLGMTWFISTVQSIFQTADESIGCGLPPDGGCVPEGYWYKTEPTAGRTMPGARDRNGNLIERIPSTNKCNNLGVNPQVCYPRDNHVAEYIKDRKLIEGGFLNLKTPLDAGGVTITLLQQGDAVDANIQLQLNGDSIESIFTQRITAEYGDGRIDKITENRNKVLTALRLMVASGRSAVERLLSLGDSFYSPLNPLHYTSLTENANSYKSQIDSAVKNAIRTASVLPAGVSSTIAVDISLAAASSSTEGIMQPGLGLVLHYKATVTYTESPLYYYHDESANTFAKRPVALRYIAEDYMPALRCEDWSPDPPAPVVFNWDSPRDMVCCAGYLFSCSVDIPNLAANQKIPLGGQIEGTSPSDPQGVCNGILGGAKLRCTPAGFVTE